MKRAYMPQAEPRPFVVALGFGLGPTFERAGRGFRDCSLDYRHSTRRMEFKVTQDLPQFAVLFLAPVGFFPRLARDNVSARNGRSVQAWRLVLD